MSEAAITNEPSVKERIKIMMHNMSEWFDLYTKDGLLDFLGFLAELIKELIEVKEERMKNEC